MSDRSSTNMRLRREASAPAWINAAALFVLVLVLVTGVVVAVRFKPMTVIMNSLAQTASPPVEQSHGRVSHKSSAENIRATAPARLTPLSR